MEPRGRLGLPGDRRGHRSPTVPPPPGQPSLGPHSGWFQPRSDPMPRVAPCPGWPQSHSISAMGGGTWSTARCGSHCPHHTVPPAATSSTGVGGTQAPGTGVGAGLGSGGPPQGVPPSLSRDRGAPGWPGTPHHFQKRVPLPLSGTCTVSPRCQGWHTQCDPAGSRHIPIPSPPPLSWAPLKLPPKSSHPPPPPPLNPN